MSRDKPFVTTILLSHNKPQYVVEAITSVIRQTFANWHAIIWDNGVLFDQGFYDSLPMMADPRIELVRSDETEDIRQNRVVASWCFNQCIERGLVKGEFLMYLCDDDIYYPHAFATFADYSQQRREVDAMYASLYFVGITGSGQRHQIMTREATEMKGRSCGGGGLDCAVDGMQVCHRLAVPDRWETRQYWSEDRAHMRHADGVYLEKLGSYVPIHPVGVFIGENRKTPLSINDPTGP